MARVPLALAFRSNQTRHGYEGAARLINCYAEALDKDAKGPVCIYPTEGLDPWIAPAEGGVKCFLATDSYLYGVSGVTVFAIDTSFEVHNLGTLDLEASCYMARNRRSPTTQVGLVSQDTYWVIEGATMTEVTDPDLPPPSCIDVKDGYFILPTTFGRYFVTGEDDGTTVDALDFGKAQRSPGDVLRVIATETDVMLLKSDGIEWVQNQPTSTATFPFVPVAAIDLGLRNAEAAVRLNRDVFWIANDGTVRRMNGYGGDIISTGPVERDIGALSSEEAVTAAAWTVPDAGKTFVSFRSSLWCWVYDIEGGAWHERKSHGSDTWRVGPVTEWGGYVLAGDADTGMIYRMSRLTYSEGGYPIKMVIQTPPVDATPDPLFVNCLDVMVIPGQGVPTVARADITDPDLLMDYSDDGGRTWSTQRSASMGKSGESLRRVRFTRLGMIRRNGRTFRFQLPASTARGVTAAVIDVEKGSS